MLTSFPRLLVLFATLSVAFGGCLSSPKLRNISVQLVNVEVRERGATAELALSIRYINENLLPVAVSETRHRLTLNGIDVGRIESEEAVGLPQLGEDTQPVVITVDGSTLQRIRQSLGAENLATYQLESRLFIESGANEIISDASGTGTVTVNGLAR